MPLTPVPLSTYTTTQASHKIKVQSGAIRYSAADPDAALDFTVIGDINVSSALNIGGVATDTNSIIATGDATAESTGRLDITTGTYSSLNLYENSAGGSLFLNNVKWPSSTLQPTPGMFVGVSALNTLTYHPFIIATVLSDTLSLLELNAMHAGAQPGQCVLGPSVIYYAIGQDRWRVIDAGMLS